MLPTERPNRRAGGRAGGGLRRGAGRARGVARRRRQRAGRAALLLRRRGLLRHRAPLHAPVRGRPAGVRGRRSRPGSCSLATVRAGRGGAAGGRRAAGAAAAVGARWWRSVLALGALGTGLAFVLNYRVIRLAGATTSAQRHLPDADLRHAARGAGAAASGCTWYEPVGALVILAGVAIAQGLPSSAGSTVGPGRATQSRGSPARRTGSPACSPSRPAASGPGVDDRPPRRRTGGPLAAVVEPVELARGVRVGVDGEQAAQPRTPARSSRLGGSSRSGRQLISTALPCCDAGGEDRLGVELGSRPALAAAVGPVAAAGRSASLRPVQWPRMSRCGFATAASIRRVIASALVLQSTVD